VAEAGLAPAAGEVPAAAEQLFANAVGSVAEALQAKDAYTRSHSQRVSGYASVIAHELGLCQTEVDEIRLAAQLHDVGKIGVPDGVLSKDGPLTDDERRTVQWHTVIGEQILRPLLKDHPRVLAAVRWHHERMDGLGFPDGLQGAEIPLAARIIAVADTFDAMTTARPYRSSQSLRVVVRELDRVAGAQLDTRCVRALLAVLRQAPHLFPNVRSPSGWAGWPLMAWLALAAIYPVARLPRGSGRRLRRPSQETRAPPPDVVGPRAPPGRPEGGRLRPASAFLRTP
jgi:HD-GYP domain-containing protein (c-di-GMP phosphodiesterase class II)